MRAITYDHYGDPDNLTLSDLPEPKVGPAEVLIRVRSAAVNPVDWKVAAGGLDPLMNVTFPVVPGWDVSGVVERVGLDRSTIAEVIGRLIRRGLLDKVRDPQDGRRFLLRLTDDGVRTHRRLTVRTARMNQVFLAPLDADEQALFIDLIRRVADAAEGLRDPAPTLTAPR